MFFLGLRLPFHPLGGVKITTRRSRLRASEHAQRCHLILQFILFRLIGRAEWSDVACVGCYSFWHYDPSEPSGRFGCVSKAVPEVPCIPLRSVKGIFSFFLSFFLSLFKSFSGRLRWYWKFTCKLVFSPILGFMLRVCWYATPYDLRPAKTFRMKWKTCSHSDGSWSCGDVSDRFECWRVKGSKERNWKTADHEVWSRLMPDWCI